MTLPLRLPAVDFRKTTLPNGLDVVVRRQPNVPLVAVNLWYHVGSKNEERRQRGFAHLFEHLMFEGSEHYPGDFFKPLQRLGGRVNGSTSSDRTNYFVDLPSAHLETAIAMESDRMGFFLPALTDEKLSIQKGVVTNEYRQNYANRPYGQVSRLVAEAMYPSSHPYSWITIGAMEDVEAASRADVEAFFRRFYVPANASLCLVGDLDEDEAIGLAERYFGEIPGGTAALRPSAPAAQLDGDVPIRHRERVELDRLHLDWHTVPQFHEDEAALAILGDLLARGRSSRLYKKLVMDLGLAQSVSAYQWGRELAGSFGLAATMRPGKSWEQVRDLADEEIGSLMSGVQPAELERAKMGRLGAFLYALDGIGGFGGVADRLNAYNVYLGDPSRITTDYERFARVTEEDVIRVARTFLDRRSGRGRVEMVVQGVSKSAGTLDRSVPPRPSRSSRFRVPSPIVDRLDCGAELWVLPSRDLPIVSATLVMRGGASVHGPERGGLAQSTAAMLDEGTISRSAVDLAVESEGMATSLSSTCGWDGSYVSLRCLRPNLEASFDLACDILLNPTFPEAEWERVRGQTLAHLQAERDRAESRAYRALLEELFPGGHPYRIPAEGSIETVGNLSREDLVAFHRSRYRPGAAAWVVAGDVEPSDVAAILNERLKGWSGVPEERQAVGRPEAVGGRRILVLHRPAAPQASVRVGHVGVDRRASDHLDLMVLNQVLGGQFVSRLNRRIREEKGLTYGIRSSFDTRLGAGPFSVSAAIQTDRVAEALGDIVGEIEGLLGPRPTTNEELDDAKQALIEGQARHFESPSELVTRYASLFVYGLPMDEHATLPDRLGRVTVDSALAAGRAHLRPNDLLAVVVADADEVMGPLEKLGWGSVEVRDR